MSRNENRKDRYASRRSLNAMRHTLPQRQVRVAVQEPHHEQPRPVRMISLAMILIPLAAY